jgi:hypothetical protein
LGTGGEVRSMGTGIVGNAHRDWLEGGGGVGGLAIYT